MPTQNSTKHLLKLRLSPGEASMDVVRKLEGISDLSIDEDYGLICLSPKRRMYSIRVLGPIDQDQLKDKQPRVLGVFGEVKISTIHPK